MSPEEVGESAADWLMRVEMIRASPDGRAELARIEALLRDLPEGAGVDLLAHLAEAAGGSG